MPRYTTQPQNWIPASSNETNVTVGGFGQNKYFQVSNMVYCSGTINISPSSTSCSFNLSIPVSAPIGTTVSVIGVGSINDGFTATGIGNFVTIRGDSTNNLPLFDFQANTSNTTTMRYNFIYRRNA